MTRTTARRRIHPLSWAALGVLLAAIIAWPLGGWDTVRLVSADPPDLAVGDVFEGRRFALALERAEVTVLHPDGYSEPEPGGAFVVLHVIAENRWREPEYSWNLTREMLTVDVDGVALIDGGVYRAVDNGLASNLGPGIPIDLLLIWELPAALIDAAELHVEFWDGVPRQDSEILAGTVWRDLRILAESSIPLEQATA